MSRQVFESVATIFVFAREREFRGTTESAEGMTMRKCCWVFVWMGISIASCSKPGGTPKCVPGAVNPCSCQGNTSGVQTCSEDGTYAPCDCPAPSGVTCPSSFVCPDGATCDCQVDASTGAITSVTLDHGGDGEDDARHYYQYGDNLVLTHLMEDVDMDGHIDSGTTFAYDEEGRLLRETIDSNGDGRADSTSVYRYDDSGSRTLISHDEAADGSVERDCHVVQPCFAPYVGCNETCGLPGEPPAPTGPVIGVFELLGRSWEDLRGSGCGVAWTEDEYDLGRVAVCRAHETSVGVTVVNAYLLEDSVIMVLATEQHSSPTDARAHAQAINEGFSEACTRLVPEIGVETLGLEDEDYNCGSGLVGAVSFTESAVLLAFGAFQLFVELSEYQGTSCGDPSTGPPPGVSATSWDEYVCGTEEDAGQNWGGCLRSIELGPDIVQCPSPARCCPGSIRAARLAMSRSRSSHRFYLGQIEFRVQDLEVRESVGRGYSRERAASGASYVVAEYTALNRASQSLTVVGDSVVLLDSVGREFSPASGPTTAVAMSNDQDLFLSELQPGVIVGRTVVFEVPSRAVEAGVSLRFADPTLFGSGTHIVTFYE